MGSLLLLRRRYAELLSNPGYETPGGGDPDFFANWTETVGDGAIARTTTAGQFRSGVAAAKLTSGATSNTSLAQAATVVPGVTYQLTFWCRGDGTNAGRYAVWDSTNSAWIKLATSTGLTGAAFAQVAYTFTVPAGCIAARPLFYPPAVNTAWACFDDVSLKRR